MEDMNNNSMTQFKKKKYKKIYKIQLPIVGDWILAYDKDKEEMLNIPVTDHMKKFMNGEYKKFAYAEIKGEQLIISEEAPWQNW